MAYKRFDRELFEKYDKLGRDAAKRYYSNLGYEVLDNENKYGPDLILQTTGSFIAYVECEVKRKWITEKFPSDIIRFPERKSKYLTGQQIYFFMTNVSGSYALIVDGKELKEESLKEFKNTFVPKGEMFFHVALENAAFVVIAGSAK